MASLTVSEVNKMNGEQFEWVFGNVIELCIAAASKVYKELPFKTVEDVCSAFHKYLENLSAEGMFRLKM
jgi:2-oxo-4-hydroxy-4-carboxy--5-ureidoimidazoline (OHCU) decarboxylase